MHREYGEEPDHESCPMPQELRWPQFRTDDAQPEIIKTLGLYNLLSHPGIVSRSLQDMAIQTVWPNMNVLEAELFLHGVMELDDMNKPSEKN